MAELEEIIVRGQRLTRSRFAGFREVGTGQTLAPTLKKTALISAIDQVSAPTDLSKAGQAMKPIEEVKVTAKRKPVPRPKKFGVTARDLFKDDIQKALERSVEAKLRAAKVAPFEEIKVIAKRLPKVGLLRSVLPFGGPLINIADIGSRISDVISQRRLDEVGDLATRTVKPKPDTPVKTIPPEIIDEIVVTAKRPRAKRPVMPRDFSDRDTAFFDAGVQFPSQKPTAVVFPIAPPRQSPKPKTPVDVQPFTFTRTNARPGPAPQPRTGPRSFLLNIPKRTTPGDLTRFNPNLLGLPITASAPQLAASGCEPCPKPKEKKRNKCYKGLTKQGRFPRNDKFTKWVEINCRTKREI